MLVRTRGDGRGEKTGWGKCGEGRGRSTWNGKADDMCGGVEKREVGETSGEKKGVMGSGG